jgi:hypothetical protein
MFNRIRRFVASVLIVSLSALAIPLPAQAGMIATDTVVAHADRGQIASLLMREDVRQQLKVYGVSAGEVQARVDALTDAELAQLAGQMGDLPAGGDALIGAIVFIFVLLLITDILGLTHIFPFTRSVR